MKQLILSILFTFMAISSYSKDTIDSIKAEIDAEKVVREKELKAFKVKHKVRLLRYAKKIYYDDVKRKLKSVGDNEEAIDRIKSKANEYKEIAIKKAVIKLKNDLEQESAIKEYNRQKIANSRANLIARRRSAHKKSFHLKLQRILKRKNLQAMIRFCRLGNK